MEVTLNPSETQRVAFPYTPPAVGRYRLSVESEVGYLDVYAVMPDHITITEWAWESRFMGWWGIGTPWADPFDGSIHYYSWDDKMPSTRAVRHRVVVANPTDDPIDATIVLAGTATNIGINRAGYQLEISPSQVTVTIQPRSYGSAEFTVQPFSADAVMTIELYVDGVLLYSRTQNVWTTMQMAVEPGARWLFTGGSEHTAVLDGSWFDTFDMVEAGTYNRVNLYLPKATMVGPSWEDFAAICVDYPIDFLYVIAHGGACSENMGIGPADMGWVSSHPSDQSPFGVKGFEHIGEVISLRGKPFKLALSQACSSMRTNPPYCNYGFLPGCIGFQEAGHFSMGSLVDGGGPDPATFLYFLVDRGHIPGQRYTIAQSIEYMWQRLAVYLGQAYVDAHKAETRYFGNQSLVFWRDLA